MDDYSKLQELAEGANAVTGDVHVEMTIASDAGPNQAEIDAVTAFMEAATPAVVLELIAEIKRLTVHDSLLAVWMEKTEWVQTTCHSQELGMHRADAILSRIEHLKAEIVRLRTAEGDAMTYKAGMENVAQQRDQLKAEVKENEMHMRAFGEVMKSQAGQIEQLKAEVERLEGDCDSHLEAHGKLGVHYFELKVDSEALRKALTDIRENSSDLGACECAADALAASRKKAIQ